MNNCCGCVLHVLSGVCCDRYPWLTAANLTLCQHTLHLGHNLLEAWPVIWVQAETLSAETLQQMAPHASATMRLHHMCISAFDIRVGIQSVYMSQFRHLPYKETVSLPQTSASQWRPHVTNTSGCNVQ